MSVRNGVSAWVAFVLLLTGCASPSVVTTSVDIPPGISAILTTKKITVAFAGNPPALAIRLAQGGSGGTGLANLESLVNRGLSIRNSERLPIAQLAEDVPSLDNGLWELLPEGRMLTTWKIRANAAWHDGTPFTTADLLFTAKVDQDRELPLAPNPAYRSIESMDALDAQTISVTWRRPYIHADELFGDALLPQHLLQSAYADNKVDFLALPYWASGYVGTGPYKLQVWEQGSHMIVHSYEAFVLGAPKIDEIEVRFIPDLNTLVANVLAGAVETSLGGASPSLDQATQAREQWKDGKVQLNVDGWIVAFPQLYAPNPAIVGDVRFRQALLYGLDRQQLVDGIQGGQGSVAHVSIGPNEPEFRDIEDSIVRYDFDPRRAAQMLEELGLTRGSDGVYRDAQGKALDLEVRSTGTYDAAVKAMSAAADFWQQMGLVIEQVPVPQQRQADREYRANFGGLHVQRQPTDTDNISATPAPKSHCPRTTIAARARTAT